MCLYLGAFAIQFKEINFKLHKSTKPNLFYEKKTLLL